MKKYVIDTNALISFVTDRSLKQQMKIACIIEEAAALKSFLYCPQNVLTEFVYVMDKVYKTPKVKISEMLQDFVDMPGIEIIHEIKMDILLAFWPGSIPDYGDAIVASIGKNIKGAIVATFDKAFRLALRKQGIPVIPL